MPKTLRFGKFKKSRSDKENQFVWSLKQFGKLSGAKTRELKALLDSVIAEYMTPKE